MTNSRVARAVQLILALSCSGMAFNAYAQGAPGEASEPPGELPEGVLETVEVNARQRAAAAGVVQERIEEPVVADFLDAAQISRVGDSSVSLALRRLPGVTLVSDQFIYVRGLGERYSSTTLNGANVPSPDLSRNTIPLDLFPSAIIDSLAVVKGYTTDRPAAFGGGNVDIRTRSIPDRPLLSVELGSGSNSDGSDDGLTYSGGGDDWLGTDDGTRELPGAIRSAVQRFQGNISPANILQALRRDGGSYTIADAEAVNRELATSLNRDIQFRETSLDPDLSVELVGGNSWSFGEDRWRIGAIGLVDYGNQWRNRERTLTSQQFPDTTFANTRQTVNQVSLTGSLNTGVQFTDDHRVEVSGLYLRSTDDDRNAVLKTGPSWFGPLLMLPGGAARQYPPELPAPGFAALRSKEVQARASSHPADRASSSPP
ncbi:MAG: TonB-dependent receptor plug domain-containing protein [Rhodospirillaceae bacterium]|nr:TonB-dependent receptor plug domain-containing protein [Rhodospirillaceae bacterium]